MTKKKRLYWGEDIDKKVLEFQAASDKKTKDRIFTNFLYKPFKRLSIEVLNYLTKRKGMPVDEFMQEECITTSITLCYHKIGNFDASKGFKSFSFFQTVVKNNILNHLTNMTRKMDGITLPIEGNVDLDTDYSYEEDDQTNQDLALEIRNKLQEALDRIKNTTKSPYKTLCFSLMIEYLDKNPHSFNEEAMVEYILERVDFAAINIYRYLNEEGMSISIEHYDSYKLESKFRWLKSKTSTPLPQRSIDNLKGKYERFKYYYFKPCVQRFIKVKSPAMEKIIRDLDIFFELHNPKKLN